MITESLILMSIFLLPEKRPAEETKESSPAKKAKIVEEASEEAEAPAAEEASA